MSISSSNFLNVVNVILQRCNRWDERERERERESSRLWVTKLELVLMGSVMVEIGGRGGG